MEIRKALFGDIDALVALGERFFAFSAYSAAFSFDASEARQAIAALLESGCVFVAEKSGELVGGIAGIISSPWFCPSKKTAVELAWWVDDSHRNGLAGVRLLRAFEEWGRQSGASFCTLTDLVIEGIAPASDLFVALGYALTERAHVKGLS